MPDTETITRPDLDKLTRGICTLLGDGWDVVPMYPDMPKDTRLVLTRNGVKFLFLSAGEYQQRATHIRVSIYGGNDRLPQSSYEYDQRRKELTTGINCAISKGAAGITKDITRKLLDNAIELEQLYNRLLAEQTASAASGVDRAEQIRAVLGMGDVRGDKAYGSMTVHYYTKDGTNCIGYGDVRPSFDNTLEMKLTSVPFAVGVAICKLLNMAHEGSSLPLELTHFKDSPLAK